MQCIDTLACLLPPPDFLRMPSVGIDISDSSLKYLKFKSHMLDAGDLQVTHHGERDIAPATLERGAVTDTEKLAEHLTIIAEETETPYVRLSLPEERAYLFETEIDDTTSFDEVRSLLEFRLEENVPLSPRDAYFDYELYRLPYVDGVLGVSVTAYAKETIDGYLEACTKAGVMPLSFEVEAQAIMRAVLPPHTAGTYCIVDMGKTRTGLGIVHNGVLMYTSTIDIGGAAFSEKMRTVLGDVSEGELTALKNESGIVAEPGREDVCNVLTEIVASVVDELKRQIEYWNNRDETDEDRYIEEIILCGGSVNMRGLPEYLETELDIRTVRANVWQNVRADVSS